MIKPRKIKLSTLILMILPVLLIFTNSCQKDETDVPAPSPQSNPVFTINHIFISVGGKDYIQFVTCCASESVKLDTAKITDPGINRYSYEYYSDTADYQIFSKNESFTFPEDFPKQSGIWTFTFIGQRYKDNSDYSSVVIDTIY